MPALILRLKARELRRVSIGAGEVSIGRDSDCDIVIDHAGVSNEHALLEDRGDEYVLTDTSKNGTFINGERMEGSKALVDGDEVQIGRYTLVFAPLLAGDSDSAIARREERRQRKYQSTVEMTQEQVESEVAAGEFGFEDEAPPELQPSEPPPGLTPDQVARIATVLIFALGVFMIAGYLLVSR